MEWMTDLNTRGLFVTNSLRHRRDELRTAARRCRGAYTKDYMGAPAKWLAAAYDEAAQVLDQRLAEIEKARTDGQSGDKTV